MDNEQDQQEALQQLEARFCHTDLSQPVIRTLYAIQLDTLNTNQSE